MLSTSKGFGIITLRKHRPKEIPFKISKVCILHNQRQFLTSVLILALKHVTNLFQELGLYMVFVSPGVSLPAKSWGIFFPF
jgi:hypothetical protein